MSDQNDVLKELRMLAGETFGVPAVMVTVMVGDQVVIARGDLARFEVIAQRAPNLQRHDPSALASVARTIVVEADRLRAAKANDIAQLRRQLVDAEASLARIDARLARLRVLGELPNDHGAPVAVTTAPLLTPVADRAE